ncbi:MAG: TraB/GumN family protein [Bacteroidia bacterium]
MYTKRWILLIISLLGLQVISAQTTEKNQLLWRINHPDLPQSSYLYGTMHVRDNRAFNFSDSVLAALYRCEVYAMEIHPEDAIEKLLTNMDAFQHPKISDVLDAETYQKLQDRFQAEMNISLDQIRVNQLDLLEDLLGESKPDTADKTTFVDAYLYELAIGWEKRAVGLENIDEHIGTVMESQAPDPGELSEYLLYRLESQEKESYLESLKAIYEKGDLEAIDKWIAEKYQDDETGERIKDFDLIARNYIQADSIASLARLAPTFAAVGAAHLPGSEGVIEILRKKGFTLTPVKATFTGLKDYYEKLPRKEKTWKMVDMPLFGYRMEVPIKPVPMEIDALQEVNSSTQMTFDLGTGVFYGVVCFVSPRVLKPAVTYRRLAKTYLEETEQFKNAVLVDSSTFFIHELSGREMAFTFGKGSEVFFMKMRMLVDEKMMYVLFSGLPGLPQDHPDMDRFFDRFELRPIRPPSFVEISDPKLAFSVDMLENSRRQVESEETEDSDGDMALVRTELYLAEHPETGTAYAVSTSMYPAGYIFQEDSAMLAGVREEGIANLNASEIRLDTSYLFDGHACVEISFDKCKLRGAKGWMRFITRGTRLYSMVALYMDDNELEQVERFKNSFHLLPYRYKPTSFWTTYEDSITGFAALFPNPPQVEDFGDEDIRKASASLWTDYSEESSYYYTAMDSGSSISYGMIVNQYTDLTEFEHPDSLNKAMVQAVFETMARPASNIDTIEVGMGEAAAREYVASVEGSQTHLRVRCITRGRTYFLQWAYLPEDYLHGEGADAFFSRLDISKVSADGDLFSDKLPLILERLSDSDTLSAALARRALYTCSLEADDSTALLAAFEKQYPLPTNENQDLTEAIISQELANLGVKSMASIAKKQYLRLVDHPASQAELLRNLASLDTDEAGSIFFDLLNNHPPSSFTYAINSGLSTMLDQGARAELRKTALNLVEKTDWLEDMLYFYVRAADSGLISIDSIAVIKQFVLDKVDAQIDSLKWFQKNANEDSYFSYYEYYNILRAVNFLQKDKKLLKKLAKLDGLVADDIYTKNLIMEVMLDAGEAPSRETITLMASSIYWQTDLVEALERYGQTNLLPDSLKSQEKIAFSLAVNEFDEGIPDNWEFKEKRFVNLEEGSGWVYCFVFQFDWLESNEAYIVFSGFFDEGKLSPRYTYGSSTYFYVEDINELNTEDFWEKYQTDEEEP